LAANLKSYRVVHRLNLDLNKNKLHKHYNIIGIILGIRNTVRRQRLFTRGQNPQCIMGKCRHLQIQHGNICHCVFKCQ